MQGKIYTLFLANLFFVLCLGHQQFEFGNGQFSFQYPNDLFNFADESSSKITFMTSLKEIGSLKNTGTALKAIPQDGSKTSWITGGPLGDQKLKWKEIVYSWSVTEQGIQFTVFINHYSPTNSSQKATAYIPIPVVENSPDNPLLTCFLDDLFKVEKVNSTLQTSIASLIMWNVPQDDPESTLDTYIAADGSYFFKINPKTPPTMNLNEFNRINAMKGNNGQSLGQGGPQLPTNPPVSEGNPFTIKITAK